LHVPHTSRAVTPPPPPPHTPRFVPDDSDFSGRQVRDAAAEVPPGYTPPDMFTTALQHTDPTLTWDADDRRRKKVRARVHMCWPFSDGDL
jgi:hypothetical protein